MRRGVLAGAVAASSLPLAAQHPSPLPPPPTPPITAIRAGTLIDGTGGAPPRNAGGVVQGGRIVALGPSGSAPPGATVVGPARGTPPPRLIRPHLPRPSRTAGDGDWAP